MVDHVECLAHAAQSYSQSAYAEFTHSLSFEWSFLQRVVGGLKDEYIPLRDVIHTVLAPAILGREVLQTEHDLLSLPAKFGGLALSDPVQSTSVAYETLKKATELLIEAVNSGTPVDSDVYRFDSDSNLKEATKQRMADQSKLAKQIISTLLAPTQRTLQRIVQSNASTWVTVLPLQADSYDLSATQFRDQLAIRYHHEPAGLPSKCDGCGESFSLQHGLDCKKVA